MTIAAAFRRATGRYLFGRWRSSWTGIVAIVAALFPGDLAAQSDDYSNGLPLEPTRTIEFTVEEGTWLNLDVSPDGKTIAFELIGDLYTMPITGGNATRITEGMGYDQLPQFTPDGRTIIFSTDRSGYTALWRVAAGGDEARELTWTEREREFEDYRMVPETQTNRDTTKLGAVSPDGRYKITTSRNDDGYECTDSATFALHDLKADTTIEEWAYAGFDCGLGTAPASAYTPDGSAFITAYGGKIRRIEVPSGTMSVIPFVAEVRQHLAPLVLSDQRLQEAGGPTYTAKQIRDVSLSPDGKRLVFVAFDRLWLKELPDGTPVRLTSDELTEAWPVWSPDGRYIAYVTWIDGRGQGGSIRRVRAPAPSTVTVSDVGRSQPRAANAVVVTSEGGVAASDAQADDTIAAAAHLRTVHGEPTLGLSSEALTREPGYYDRLNYTPDGSKLIAVWRPIRHLREKPSFSVNDLEPLPGAEWVWIPAEGGFPITIAPARPTVDRRGNAHGLLQVRYGFPHFMPDSTGDPAKARLVRFEAGNWRFGRAPADSVTSRLVRSKLDGSDREVLLLIDIATRENPFEQPPSFTRIVNEVILSPTGKHAIALSNQAKVHLLTLPPPPEEGDTTKPRIVIGSEDSEHARRITPLDEGGSFIRWREDGKGFYYAFGRTFFQYDLETARSTRTEIEVTVPRNRGSGVIAFRNARLITMRGKEIIENGTIVVTNDRITAVGPVDEVSIPPDARVIDATGKTILPNYADLHDHIIHNAGVHNTQSWKFLANLAYAVTLARDPQMLTDDAMSYEDMTRAGRIVGPRYLNTGPGIAVPSGDSIASLDHARAVLRRYRDYWRVITWKEYVSGDRKTRQWLAMASRELGMVPVSHTQLRQTFTLALDGYPEADHPLGVTPLYQDFIQFFARSGTLLSNANGRKIRNYFSDKLNLADEEVLVRFTPPNALQAMKESSYILSPDYERKDSAKVWRESRDMARIAAAGGKLGAAQHGEIPGLGTHLELWAYVKGGMPEHDALRAGTINGANVIGLGKLFGSIEPGKLADLHVLDANPLIDIHNSVKIRYVMIDGRLFDARTLDQLWPTERKLDPPWWWFESEETAVPEE